MKIVKLLLIGLLFTTLESVAQVNLEEKTYAFYADLNKGDSAAVRDYFHPESRVKHIGEKEVLDLSLAQFIGVCQKFKSDYYAEEVNRMEVKHFENGLAYVDVYFDFYVEGSYTHSGLDHFCWSNRNGELKIESVYSTNFKEGLPLKNDANALNKLIDQWHKDVAESDFDAYFGLMDESFIFLGTDPSERWTKKEFADFSKPYFDRKSTWDFKPKWRNWYFSNDQNTAWFEEALDTWMEECRGSGVMVKIDGEWKIVHYNLAVVIENEKMKKFIKLRRK